VLGVESGQHHDPRVRRSLDDVRDRLQPIHHRHGEIEDDGVRLLSLRELHRGLAVLRFADDREAPIGLEGDPEEHPDLGGVVGEEHPDRLAHRGSA
jgi:hypothetical protein